MHLGNICWSCTRRMFPCFYVFVTFASFAGFGLIPRGRLVVADAQPTGEGGGRGGGEGGGGGGGVAGGSSNGGDLSGPLPEDAAPAEVARNGAYSYLRKYGYIPRENPQASSIRRLEDYHSAIRSFQQFFGFPETGQMDAETTRWMSYPRCGLPDVVPDGDPGQGQGQAQGRVRRFAHSGVKWDKDEVTYRILNFSPDLPEADIVHAFELAFKVWSDVTPLTFRRVLLGGADIYIQFSVSEHGDGFAFDGEGGTLAHAYFPGDGIGGDAHFDDDESFTLRRSDPDGTDLFMVAVHEFGHSLGLGHSSDVGALMAPFYMGYDADFRLSYDDLHGIQSLYGVNPNPPPVGATYIPLAPPTTPDPDADRCRKSFNAIAAIRQEIFLFKGKNFWRMRVKNEPLEGYPVDIGVFWPGLPTKIDASYERYDGKIVFVKGSEYWVFKGIAMEEGYPRRVHDLGLPKDIDAALSWGQTGKTYFFKGDEYWRYDEFDKRVDKDYPKLIKENWIGVPNNIDAAFRYNDGYTWDTYFIRHRRYWRFDESRGAVDLGFPRSFDADWLDCVEEKEVVDGPAIEKPGQLRDTMYRTMSSPTTDSGCQRWSSMSKSLYLLWTLIALRVIHRLH